ncbi:hypothetical protein AB0P21_40185 [Kribbella sp. NPDC056861]|uniref:hypothetical protein n=1 Tax=Kribbella sp. NPDC056861 TaxID=3154857 RepID=UPI003442A22B
MKAGSTKTAPAQAGERAVVIVESGIFVNCSVYDAHLVISTPSWISRAHPQVVAARGLTHRPLERGEGWTEVYDFEGQMFSVDWQVRTARQGKSWSVQTGQFGWRGVQAAVNTNLQAVDGGTRILRRSKVAFGAGHQECESLRRQAGDVAVASRYLANVKYTLEHRFVSASG